MEITDKLSNEELLEQDYQNCEDVIIKGEIWKLLIEERRYNEGKQ